jgi:hypothetical protein
MPRNFITCKLVLRTGVLVSLGRNFVGSIERPNRLDSDACEIEHRGAADSLFPI